MCDNLVNKGYYFSPYTLAILRKNMSPMQILVASGSFFRTSEDALKRFWMVRLFRVVIGLLFGVILLNIIF